MDMPVSTLLRARNPQALVDGEQDALLRDLQSMIDGLSELVALVDCDGTIRTVNQRWRREIERRRVRDFDLGGNYSSALTNLIEAGDHRLKPVRDAFRDISQGVRRTFRCVYVGSGILAGHDYRISISEFIYARSKYVLVSAEDLTEFNSLKRQRRRMDTQVLRAQEEERRRLARELHDSVSQMLVALDLNLLHLRGRVGGEAKALISECKQEVKEIQREVRSFSYIAHPPPLSNHDLGLSLERLTTGFAARTGLEIDLQLSDVGEASSSIELALYRLAQEALSNIHRHASAAKATVRLVGTDRFLHLLIADDGVGFDPEYKSNRKPMGVGVVGMNERVRELGGRFLLRRATKGTILRVTVPRRKADA